MSKYASPTSVSAAKSREEIERTLERYGAGGFMYGWEDDRALISFKMADRYVRFVLQMPSKDEARFWKTPGGRSTRTREQAAAAWEQATRQKWRALALAVKAKLEAVDAGIATFEQEFLAHIVLPNNQTVSDWIEPQIHAAYLGGTMPKLLPAAGD